MNIEYEKDINEIKYLKLNTTTTSLCILVLSISIGIGIYFCCLIIKEKNCH